MKRTETLLNWIQVASAVAVLIGLGLVVMELRQSHDIARAEIFASSNDATMQMLASIAGENPTESLAKACSDTDALTNKDLLVLDQLYTLWWLKAARHLAQSSDSAALAPAQAESVAMTFIVQINGTDHGRWWWENYPNTAYMREVGERALASTSYHCADFLESFRSLDEISWAERGIPTAQ